MPVLDNSLSLQIGIQKDFMDIWRQKYPVFKEQQDLFLHRLPYNNQRTSKHVFKESIPFPVPWPHGMPRTYQLLRDRQIEISRFPYDLTIPFSGWDEEDDQLGDIRTHLAKTSERFLQLPVKFVGEYLNNVASLVPSISNCYDGVVLHSAVDGDGAARFGVTGGNIVTGNGISTAGIIKDMNNAQRRFGQMLDPTKDSPIYDANDIKFSDMVCVIPLALNQVFNEVAKSENLRIDLSNNVSSSNYLVNQVNFQLNPYLTDTSDWYIFLKNPVYKAFAWRGPDSKGEDGGVGGLRQIFSDFNNSDRARQYNEYAVHTDVRYGIGPLCPFSTIKINN